MSLAEAALSKALGKEAEDKKSSASRPFSDAAKEVYNAAKGDDPVAFEKALQAVIKISTSTE